jgi:hypothetical protein
VPTSNLPTSPSVENLRKQAKGLLREHKTDKAEALSRIEQSHPKSGSAATHRGQFTLQDAQLVVAVEHGFRNWRELVRAVQISGEQVGLVRDAIDQDDGSSLKRLLDDDPNLVQAEFKWTDRKDRSRLIAPFRYAHMRNALGCMEVLKSAGADSRFLGGVLWANAYNLDLKQIKRLLSIGVDPNRSGVMAAAIGSHWVFDVRRRHECINTLIEAGAVYEDGPVMDIHRGRLDALEDRICRDPSLLSSYFDYRSVDNMETGLTLLHIAAAHNEVRCAQLLLELGAGIDTKARIREDFSGGETPLYHAIGSPRGSCYDAFECLLGMGPDLAVRASINYDGKIRELTPLGYAHVRLDFYSRHKPVTRHALAREIDKLRQLGAPE